MNDELMEDIVSAVEKGIQNGKSHADIKQELLSKYAGMVYGANGVEENPHNKLIPMIEGDVLKGHQSNFEARAGWKHEFVAYASTGRLSYHKCESGPYGVKACIDHFVIATPTPEFAQAATDALSTSFSMVHATVMTREVFDAYVDEIVDDDTDAAKIMGHLCVLSDEVFISQNGCNLYAHCYLLYATVNMTYVISGVLCIEDAFDDYARPSYHEVDYLLCMQFDQNHAKRIYTDTADVETIIQSTINRKEKWANYISRYLGSGVTPTLVENYALRFGLTAFQRDAMLTLAPQFYSYIHELKWMEPGKPVIFVTKEVMQELDRYFTNIQDPYWRMNGGCHELSCQNSYAAYTNALINKLIITVPYETWNCNSEAMDLHRDFDIILLHARRYSIEYIGSSMQHDPICYNIGGSVALTSFKYQNIAVMISKSVVDHIIEVHGGTDSPSKNEFMDTIIAFQHGWKNPRSKIRPIVYTTFSSLIRDLMQE